MFSTEELETSEIKASIKDSDVEIFKLFQNTPYARKFFPLCYSIYMTNADGLKAFCMQSKHQGKEPSKFHHDN
jgi:hypothetical protein